MEYYQETNLGGCYEAAFTCSIMSTTFPENGNWSAFLNFENGSKSVGNNSSVDDDAELDFVINTLKELDTYFTVAARISNSKYSDEDQKEWIRDWLDDYTTYKNGSAWKRLVDTLVANDTSYLYIRAYSKSKKHRFEYAVGNSVVYPNEKINCTKTLTISYIDDDSVTLVDPDFPLWNLTVYKEDFESKVLLYPANRKYVK